MHSVQLLMSYCATASVLLCNCLCPTVQLLVFYCNSLCATVQLLTCQCATTYAPLCNWLDNSLETHKNDKTDCRLVLCLKNTKDCTCRKI